MTKLDTLLVALHALGAAVLGLWQHHARSDLRLATTCASVFVAGLTPTVTVPAPDAANVMDLCNGTYAVGYAPAAHDPLWSAEHLTEEDLEAASGLARHNDFHGDARLGAAGATLGDYRHSGYQRGHMTPSGDAANPAAQDATYALSNVVPQTAALNEGVWEGIESAIRGLARRDGEIYVVTGPIFRDRPPATIGSDGVWVPTGTWKAVYDPADEGAAAYACPNSQDTPVCVMVTLDTLRRETGVDPFPSLTAAIKSKRYDLPRPEDSPYDPTRTRGQHRHYDIGWSDRLLD